MTARRVKPSRHPDETTLSTRRWRVCGYAGKDLHHESTVTGDQALDDAMKSLEARPGITRITAAPV